MRVVLVTDQGSGFAISTVTLQAAFRRRPSSGHRVGFEYVLRDFASPVQM